MIPARVPDAIEPLVGWRYWCLNPRSGYLTSLTKSHVWKPLERFEASCRIARGRPVDTRYQLLSGITHAIDDVPGEHCSCGVYASRNLQRLRGQLLFGLGLTVVGEVSLWGKVIPGTGGFRAQYAYPKRLYAIRRTAAWDQTDVVDSLRVYGVPVESIAYRDVGFHPWSFTKSFVSNVGASWSDMLAALSR